MKRCIINVAGGGWYPRGQARLRQSLIQHHCAADFLGWCDALPPGSPPHSEVPYAFKSYAFQEAVRLGYETILWLDASCWAIQPLEPLFSAIEAEGHVFSRERYPKDTGGAWVQTGTWVKDAALPTLGITRDEAMEIPMLGGMFLGLCLHTPRSKEWLRQFTAICQDGHTLVGAHANVNNCVSTDPRVRGHRHDQAVASVLAFQLGMALSQPPLWRDWAVPVADPSTVIFANGM